MFFLSATSQDSLDLVEDADKYLGKGKIEIREIDREKWKELTEGLDYSEEIPNEEPVKYEEPDPEAVNTTAEIIKWLLIVGGLAIVIFILYKILTGDPLFARSDKKLDKSAVSYAENADEEELIEETLDHPLARAESAGNYRLAIRLLFITVLQDLQNEGLISWKKEKTNLQYYLEIKTVELRPSFKILSRLYEDAWFGEKPVSKPEYFAQKEMFQAFKEHVSVQRAM